MLEKISELSAKIKNWIVTHPKQFLLIVVVVSFAFGAYHSWKNL